MTDAPNPDLGGLPSWYPEIFPAGPSNGFYHKMAQHSLVCIERSPTYLVVTFDNLAEAGNPRYDREPWAGKFCRDAGYSHLGILSQGPTWFRDAGLIAYMEMLRDQGFFAKFERVTFAGTSMGGFGALAFADLAPGCTVMAFSPQTTLDQQLVAWDRRFHKGIAQDWTLPRSDSNETLRGAEQIFVVYDPFLKEDRKHVERLASHDALVPLKGPGLGHKSAMSIRRMDQLKSMMTGAIEGTLTPESFRDMIRERKSLYLYRKNMEAHLERRGRPEMAQRVRVAFRKRRRAEQLAAVEAVAKVDPDPAVSVGAQAPVQAEISTADVPVAAPPTPMMQDGIALPQAALDVREPGNIWMLQEDGPDRLRYMSDRWAGRTVGFEERAGVTKVQSGELALGVVSVGHGVAVERDFLQSYGWHVLDKNLSRHTIRQGPQAVAELMLHHCDAQRRALPWVVALPASQPGTVASDVTADGPLLAQLDADLNTAAQACTDWKKTLHVDRIGLRLLAGAPGTNENDAHAHYADVGGDLQERVSEITGQSSHPVLVVSQSAGTQLDGSSEVILAEGRLEIEHPLSGFVVATPTYPYGMSPDVPATLTAVSAAVIDALEVLAVDAIHRGKPWHCPALQHARLVGGQMIAEFSAMSELILDPDRPHGFALDCADVQITSAAVDGKTVVLTLSDPLPDGAVSLTYAFGAKGQMGAGRSANQGGLRDEFDAPAPWDDGLRLHRFALSGRTKIYRH